MKKRIIYRKPIREQERFVISTTYKRTKHVRRSLELLQEMYVNRVRFQRLNERDAYDYAMACEEVAIDGVLNSSKNVVKCKMIPMRDEAFSLEQLRMKVYSAIIKGAKGIEYNSLCEGEIMNRFIQEMNYRITQYGRTLMALRNVGVYCSPDVIEMYPDFAKVARPLSESKVLAEQDLPERLAIGEFADREGNLYLFYLNLNYNDKKTRQVAIALKNNFRVYRVNPHDGKQMLTRESIDKQKIMIMPGDADLLRYQDVEEEACLIEYALKR